MKPSIWMYLAELFTAILLVGCGGGDNSSLSPDTDVVEISGAGIKGPLAFADVKIYVLDPLFPDYYDKTSPISIAITNQYAEINGLSVARKIKPPYILTIDGSNAIDLNTGVAPVINTLITVITDDMLVNNHPVFATPLTTLIFHMARLNTEASSYKNIDTKRKAFGQNINDAASIISSTFAVGQDTNIDLFRAPLIINEYTTDLGEQELAVYHRASVEAFAAKVHASTMNGDTTADAIILNLALDLHKDSVIDNANNGVLIGDIDPTILSEDPMELVIPNTTYRIKDIMTLMDEERVLIGTDMGPIFFMEKITLPEGTTSTNITTTKTYPSDTLVPTDPVVTPELFPVELFGAIPEESAVIVNVYKPADAVNGIMTLSTYDADFPSEGELVINGNTPIALFGSKGVSANDNSLADITISTPASYWNDGDNTLIFRHTSTAGYSINGVAVLFNASNTDPRPVATLSVDNIGFGSQDVGVISDPWPLTLSNNGAAPLTISSISSTADFIEANNCNSQVPPGGSCAIDIQYVPTTSGVMTGTLTVIGDDAVGTHIVSLTGTGNDGDQSDVPPSNAVLHVDFSNRSLGLYRNADIRQDFNVNLNGYNDTVHGEDYGLMIADDPTGSGRGHVMRSVHYKGKAGTSTSAGGFRWRADMPPANEYYFTYDYYVTSDHIFPKNFKMPGLISNDLLRASHPTGTANTIDGLEGFTALMQAYSDDAWHRGDGSLGVLYYDKDKISGVDWLNTIDPTSEAKTGTYRIPRGQWITIEQRMQLNTVNQSNGIMQVWVNGVLVLDENTHKWIASNVGFDNSGQKIDGIFMTSYYGGNPGDPLNHAAQTQYHYYDNFIVSTSPITH